MSASPVAITEVRADLVRMLRQLDALGLFQAAAYLSMSIDSLERKAARAHASPTGPEDTLPSP